MLLWFLEMLRIGMEEQKKWKEMEGWDGGREVLEGGEIYILTADLHTVQQKPTQHCKVIILQLKI